MKGKFTMTKSRKIKKNIFVFSLLTAFLTLSTLLFAKLVSTHYSADNRNSEALQNQHVLIKQREGADIESFSGTFLNAEKGETLNTLAYDDFAFEPTGFRYLRLVISGSVTSFEVNMREVEWMVGTTAYPITKLSWNSTTATASQGAQPWAAYDGNLATTFGGNLTTYPSTLTLDLGTGVSIWPTAIIITPEWDGRAMSGFVCQGSNDNDTWTDLLTVSGLTQSSWARDVPRTFNIPPAVTDIEPPSVPTSLSATSVSATSFTLSWMASTDNVAVTGYDVFRDGVLQNNTTATSLNITGLSPATTYQMTVRARDAADNLSAQSAALAVTTNNLPPSTRTNQMGMNLSNPGLDWGPDKPFADAMRSHRQWIQIGLTNNQPEPPLDANYWPMTDAQCLVYAGLDTRDNHGTYRLRFTGQATVSTGDGTINSLSYDAGTNTTTANLVITNTNNANLYLTFTNTRRTPQSLLNSGITNISLMRPVATGSTTSFAEGTHFRSQFIEQLAPFNTLRTLGWIATNWNQDSLWSDRTLMSHARQSPPTEGKAYGWEGRGAAYETIILLANEAQKNLWITIPHKVTNDYLTKLAQLFRYGSDGVNPYTSPQDNPVYPPLNPNLKLYVEYSNEIWNDQFSQTSWVYQQARDNAAVKFDDKTDPAQHQYLWGMRYKALRTVEISDIFRSVFGDDQMMSRIRPVLGFQKGFIDRTNQSLTFIDAYYNKRDSRSPVTDPKPVSHYLYGAGGSFYWYSNGSPVTINNIWTNGQWDVNNRFNDQWGNPGGYYDQVTADAAWARQFGLAYLHYEGDMHPTFQGGDEAVVRQMHTGTWDSRMNQNTLDHLRVLNQAGAELSCFLQLNGYNNSIWAVRNVVNPANSPQIDAINTFNAASTLPVNYRDVPPFTRPGGSFDTRDWENPRLTGTGSINLTADNSYDASYGFHTPEGGNYVARVVYSTTAAALLDVEMNGKVIGKLTLNNTGGALVTTDFINISCAADQIHSLRLVALQGNITIQNVQVEPASILPVTLNSFLAEKAGDRAMLSWSTSTEINSKEFGVERKDPNGKWLEIATAQAAGNSNTKRHYQAFDNMPLPGMNYYRLKQTDLDGKITFSAIRTVNFTGNTQFGFKVYPNPANNRIIILSNAFGGKVNYKILSASGKQMSAGFLDNPVAETGIDISQLKKGMYILQVSDGKTTKTEKIMIQ